MEWNAFRMVKMTEIMLTKILKLHLYVEMASKRH